MKPLLKILLIICAAAGAGGFYWWKSQPAPKPAEAGGGQTAKAEGKSEGKAEGKGAGKRGGGGPVSVRIMNVTPQPMPVVIDAVGFR